MDIQIISPIGGGLPVGQSASLCKLFALSGANLNVTTDQQFTKMGSFTRYMITHIVSRGASGNALIAAGGIYSAAAKGGTAIVSAAQAWAALSAANKMLTLTLAALSDVLTTTPYLSLTTAAGGAATADIHILGIILD